MKACKAIMSVDFCANNKGLTSAAFNSNIRTSFFVLANVLTGTHNFAEGSGLTCDAFQFLTFLVVMLKRFRFAELQITEQTLEQDVVRAYLKVIFLFFVFQKLLIFLSGSHNYVLVFALNRP